MPRFEPKAYWWAASALTTEECSNKLGKERCVTIQKIRLIYALLTTCRGICLGYDHSNLSPFKPVHSLLHFVFKLARDSTK